MTSFTPHHVALTTDHLEGNRGRGRFVFLPGSEGRAARIAERFEAVEVVPSDRRHSAYLGSIPAPTGPVDVAAVATGMGCPSVDVIVTELIQLGARHLLRVGTAGSLQPDTVRRGALVIATAAVRDESTSDRYAPTEFPAVADPGMVAACCRAAEQLRLAERTFTGVVHTKDSLFAREFGFGPRTEENRAYMDQLRRLGVVASEMEAAHLFVLASVAASTPAPVTAASAAVRAGAVLAIIGDDQPFAAGDTAAQTEHDAVSLALEAARIFVADH